jgi:hypothetical protein
LLRATIAGAHAGKRYAIASVSARAVETPGSDEFGARRQTIGSRSLLAVIARERTASSVTTAGRP